MKLTVKTLQGKAFPLEAESTDTVAQVKAKIEASQGSSFGVSQQKLIHAGKVLKDEQTLAEFNVKEGDFLVVMITKTNAPKPAATPSSAPTPSVTTAAPVPVPVPATAAATPAPITATTTASVRETSAPAQPAARSVTSTPGPSAVAGEASSVAVQQLCDMGFPEDQVRAALAAAFNNPDRAVEYLMSGIPPTASMPTSRTAAPTPGATPSVEGAPPADSLEALRRHPQFASIQRLVQANPASLPAVLEQIGSRSPDLLQLIHQHQAEFVRMLNEPIATPPPTAASGLSGGLPGAVGAGAGAGAGSPTPQQIVQMLNSLPAEQRAQMAASMGMTPEQLQQISQMMASMPPEAMQSMMASVMGGGGGGLGGGGLGGGHTIQLTEEEAAAVNRLCDMGFDRNDVIQAYLACEKNEALAANFLMDSMSAGDFGAYDDGGDDAAAGDANDDIYE